MFSIIALCIIAIILFLFAQHLGYQNGTRDGRAIGYVDALKELDIALKTDFNKYLEEGNEGTWIPTNQTELKAYQLWSKYQRCKRCGKRKSWENVYPPDMTVQSNWWVKEDLCFECFGQKETDKVAR